MINNTLSFISKNVSIYKFIMEFAVENKISYFQAKQIYEKRYSEKYQTIRDLAYEYSVPYDLIISMVEDDGLNYEDINLDTIYQKIYDDYLKDNKDMQLIKDYYYYVEEILNEYRKSFSYKSIPEIISKIQKRIEAYAKKNKVSTAVATLSLYYTEKDLAQAKRMKHFLLYNQKNNIESSHDIKEDFIKYLNNSTEVKRATLHGITLVSSTEEGLNRLIETIKKVFLYGEESFLKQLEQQSKIHHLIVTDTHYDDDGAYYDGDIIIFISPEFNNKKIVDAFFHESSHFLDRQIGGPDYYSTTAQNVRDIFERIREKINTEPYEKLINNKNIPTFIRETIKKNSNKHNKGIIQKGEKYKKLKKASALANKYVNDEKFVAKWKKEIEEEYQPESEEEAQEYLVQKKRYEKDKYRRLIRYMYDIYDGLVGGLLYDKYKTPGHGREYYQEQGNDLMEMIANIGTFYNNNCMDILIFEFGEELAFELINIYKEFLDRSQKLVELQQKVEMNRMLNTQSDNKSNVSTETKGNIY